MSDESLFDATAYHRAPVLNPSTAVSLVDALAQAAPRDAPPLAVKTLKRLGEQRAAILGVQATRRKSAVLTGDRTPVQIDQAADRGWRAVRTVLAAYADLQPEFAPHQAEAEQLNAMLFGEGGLTFTTLPYDQQRTQMHTRLKALQDGGHMKVLDAIAGDAYRKNLLSTIADYDIMVMDLLTDVTPNDTALTPMVWEIQRLVVDYARYVSATVDRDEPATATAAQRTLAPIDNVRRLATGGGAAAAVTPPDAPPGGSPAESSKPE